MKLFQSIIKAITGTVNKIEVREDNERFTAVQKFTCPVNTSKKELVRFASMIPKRDAPSLSLILATPIFQTSEISNDADELISTLNDTLYLGEEIELKLQVDKTLDNGYFSIYDYDSYSEYLSKLNLNDFLNAFEHLLSQGYLTLEVFDSEQAEWSTTTCLIKGYQSLSQPTPLEGQHRHKINKLREHLCHCENTYGCLIPQDFILIRGEQPDEKLQDSFQRVSLMFILMHLFDYSSLSATEYRFKLCGYKTHAGIISTSKVDELAYRLSDYNDLCQIYKWCYEYGQHDEKMAIARNVLSLNMSFEGGANKKFTIEYDVYETIKSNYAFFERDHIRQYVEVHAKVNENILSLEEKMITCVNKYIQEFKSGLFVIASFMLSSFVLRFISKAEKLTSTILWISLVIIAIYVISFLYTTWETKQALSQYSDKFDSLRRRYQGILSQKELFDLFGDEEVYKHGKGMKFADQRVCRYQLAWLIASFMLLILVIVALVLL